MKRGFLQKISYECTQDCRNYVRNISRTFQDTIVQGICRKKSQQCVRVQVSPKFAFACSPTISPRIRTWARDPIENLLSGLRSTSKKARLEPAIWSRDTGQRIPCFDSCQLIITWMSNVNNVPMVMVLLSYYLGLKDSHVTTKIFEVDGLPNYQRYRAPLAFRRAGAPLLIL